MKIKDLHTYRCFFRYGFGYCIKIGSRTIQGNRTPKWLKPIAEFLHRLRGDKVFWIIKPK